jgi:predicted Rossmann fold flavoprotein
LYNTRRDMSLRKDVVIIGSGASGLMCAIEAGRRKRSVLLIDHAGKTASKLRVSGGGRCNFTNLRVDPSNYLSNNPHFCKSALTRFRPEDFIAMLDRHGISYYEKENGRLFCRHSAMDIVDMLHDECRSSGVDIRLNCNVGDVGKNDLFTVITDRGVFESESLVIATGGLSFPVLGASDFGYRVATRFDIRTTQLRPALVPLRLSPAETSFFRPLSGVSVDVSILCGKTRVYGEVLFTHDGISGPAVLQASLYWKKGDAVTIDLMPGRDALGLFMNEMPSRALMQTLLSKNLPRRFSKMFCERYLLSKPICRYTPKEIEAAAQQVHHWSLRPAGTAGYDLAEVTSGGVDTGELSSKTFESKKVKGLYFIGEVIDVTGQLGGYNLHWAWASGAAAGHYV